MNEVDQQSSGRSRWDSWIAGAVVLVVAVFAGPEIVNWISGLVPAAAVATQPGLTADQYIEAGMRAYRSSDFIQAEAEFRKAIQADPRSPLAYNDLGAALNDQKRWDDAIAALQKALQLNPGFDLARNNLAWSLQQKALVANGRQ